MPPLIVRCFSSVTVPAGTTVRAALLASGIGEAFPELDLAELSGGDLRQGDR